MTEIEKRAVALVNEVREGRPYTIDEAKRAYGWCFQAVCRAIERDEAFRQEVSDALEEEWGADYCLEHRRFARFIIAKPDPLVEALDECGFGVSSNAADDIRAALAARGLKIVEDK